jgi:tRNA-uridine 2-sulfurtransferase
MSKRVVIGLSGGVDSTIAALLLKKQGFEVIGLHFSFSEDKYADHIKKLSIRLDIPVIIEDINDDFDIVKKHFAGEYLKGRTPSPCTFCNRVIKWQKLIEFADKNNCEFISSGHYIRKTLYNGFYHLQKGVDPVKDQSYFMWELDSSTIKRMLNPLGDLTKKQVKQFATENGFSDLARGKESMGVCFLHNSDYRDFLGTYIPNEIKNITQGIVRDENGQIIGTHEGYIYYTIGQKRRLKLQKPREAYVSSIDSLKNELTIGTKDSLNHLHILLKNVSLINPNALNKKTKVMINIRGLGLNPQEPAIVENIGHELLELKLESPAWAVAPGQPVVLYEKDIVLGGGIAEKSW